MEVAYNRLDRAHAMSKTDLDILSWWQLLYKIVQGSNANKKVIRIEEEKKIVESKRYAAFRWYGRKTHRPETFCPPTSHARNSFFLWGVNVESVENHELWLKKRVEIEKGNRIKED